MHKYSNIIIKIEKKCIGFIILFYFFPLFLQHYLKTIFKIDEHGFHKQKVEKVI